MNENKNLIQPENEKSVELITKQNQGQSKDTIVHKPQVILNKPKYGTNINSSVVDHSMQASDKKICTDDKYVTAAKKNTKSKQYNRSYNEQSADYSSHKTESYESKNTHGVKVVNDSSKAVNPMDSSERASTSPHLKMISQRGLNGVEKCINNVAVKPGKEIVYKTSDQLKQFSYEDEETSTIANTVEFAKKHMEKSVRSTVKTAKRTAKATRKTAQTTAKVAKRSAQATAKATSTVARIASSVTHAIVSAVTAFITAITPFLPILLIVILIIVFVAALIGVLSWLFDGKTMDVEISKAYSYVTELDAEFTQKVYNTAFVLNHSGRSLSYKYYLNDNEISIDDLQIETDVETLIALYNTIYKDGWEFYPNSFDSSLVVSNPYAYDKGIFGGRTIKEDIECLHETLFSFRYEITDIMDDDNKKIVKVYIDQLLVSDILETYKEQTQELFDDMEVDMDVNEFLNLYTQEVGTFTFRNEIQNPLGTQKSDIKNRFGCFFKKDTAQEGNIAEIVNHSGVDICGSETNNLVYAGVNGTVIERTTDPNMGGIIMIKLDEKSDGKERVLAFGHLSLFYVNVGDRVTPSTQIGMLANDLVSDHGCGDEYFLHVEYMIDGYILCPSIYISGLQQDLTIGNEED